MKVLIRVGFGLCLALMTVPLVRAGEVGNGGDVIYCEKVGSDNTTQKSAQLLDFYEATLNGLTLDLGPDTLSYEQKVELLLERVAAKDTYLGPKLMQWWREFFIGPKKAVFHKDVQLTDEPDSRHIAIPQGCEIQQAALQPHRQFSTTPRYVFDLDLWEMLSEADKAGLVLHELAYRYASELKHQDSLNVRYFIGIVADINFTSIDLISYFELLNELELQEFTEIPGLKNMSFIRGSLNYYPSGNIKQGCLDTTKYRYSLRNDVWRREYVISDLRHLGHPERCWISFHENGVPSRAYFFPFGDKEIECQNGTSIVAEGWLDIDSRGKVLCP